MTKVIGLNLYANYIGKSVRCERNSHKKKTETAGYVPIENLVAKYIIPTRNGKQLQQVPGQQAHYDPTDSPLRSRDFDICDLNKHVNEAKAKALKSQQVLQEKKEINKKVAERLAAEKAGIDNGKAVATEKKEKEV